MLLGPMSKWLDTFRRTFFDVRPGEYGRTIFVMLYLLFVLFAYYILKPVSRALFVDKFDLDKLPLLYILIAPAGGILAYTYSRLAIRASLTRAVNVATAFAVGITLLMGYLIRFQWVWTYYAFNIWVSMFSIMLVTQGWVIAANVFNTREAKRLYGFLGLGAVIGAGFGGTFTNLAVRAIGEQNLIYASAGITILAYLMYRALLMQSSVNLHQARGGEQDAEFSVTDIGRDILHYRHLQVIVGIVLVTFVVDVMVEYQFQAFAKERYQGSDLTAFMGAFNGIYLNLVNFVFQFFFTAAMVRIAGVGGVLQIMPVAISIASLGIYFAPGVLSSSIARLTEAATRYTFNKTGMELLYLPLPLNLRNRVKAFLDIFVDRLGRGIGGVLLYLFTVILNIEAQALALIVLCFTAGWSVLSWVAQREYLRTIRRRMETRTLDLEGLRISAADPAMTGLLEKAARGNNARQAAYALSLLAASPGYDISSLIQELVSSPFPEVRARIFQLAGDQPDISLLPEALAEIRSSRAGDRSPAIRPAVAYALGKSPQSEPMGVRLLEHPSSLVVEEALEVLLRDRDATLRVLPPERVQELALSPSPSRRKTAAVALRVVPDEDNTLLKELLADPDENVAIAAIATAGSLRRRTLVPRLVNLLRDPVFRKSATASLAAYGSTIAGTLRDLMEDPDLPNGVRYRLPRILEKMGDQRAASELLGAIHVPNLRLRDTVVHALTRMRSQSPQLDYGQVVVERQILEEARLYFGQWLSLAAIRGESGGSQAVRLLTETLESRLRATLERLFGLLGLKYSPREMESAYRALQRSSADDHAAAIEFLDSVLNKQLKRYLMPLVDDTARLAERGPELFGIERKTPQGTLRELLQSGDVWLVSCAIAATVELKMDELKEDILALGGHSGTEVDLLVDYAAQRFA